MRRHIPGAARPDFANCGKRTREKYYRRIRTSSSRLDTFFWRKKKRITTPIVSWIFLTRAQWRFTHARWMTVSDGNISHFGRKKNVFSSGTRTLRDRHTKTRTYNNDSAGNYHNIIDLFVLPLSPPPRAMTLSGFFLSRARISHCTHRALCSITRFSRKTNTSAIVPSVNKIYCNNNNSITILESGVSLVVYVLWENKTGISGAKHTHARAQTVKWLERIIIRPL